MKIGFIGQGFIGNAYANNFEKRGYETVRYSLEPQYAANRDKIKDCRLTFIAVPTPTTPAGFSAQIIEDVLPLIGAGNIAVIKSTILPGTTARLQTKFPDIFIMHSPEFLTEKNCQHDADYPPRNIVGLSEKCIEAQGQEVMASLPEAGYKLICPAAEAEMIKYTGNCFLYVKVLYMNLVWEACRANGLDYNTVKEGFKHDPRVGDSHNNPVHQGGRGAGGHCFIKDFAAFREFYEKTTADVSNQPEVQEALAFLKEAEKYNRSLLTSTNKDADALAGVYGLAEAGGTD
jgi:UDPglucose 6-dehydrogenase